MKFADVIVPLAVDGMFTYAIPPELENSIKPGGLVLVPFAGNKKYTAIVCRIHQNKPEDYQVKEIGERIDEGVFIAAGHLKFLLWMSEYYMATPGEVIKAALPVVFRLESFTSITRSKADIDGQGLSTNESALLNFLHSGEYLSLKEVEKLLKFKNVLPVVKSLLKKGYVQVKETVDDMFREKTQRIVKWGNVFDEEKMGELLDGLKRAPVQYRMLCRWIESGADELEKSEFLTMAGNSPVALKSLCDKHILKLEERRVSRLSEEKLEEGECNQLSEVQCRALDEIQIAYKTKDCVLLQGVTSSGKTEVYIHLIREYLKRGVQVLYMLPEIALTVQIVRRLQRVFGNRIGIYHSGMSDQVRAEMWRKQCSDDPYRLILGVRSSVFLPFSRLGLIVVDEEHDASYKQKEPAPRYNGRDTAIMLARMAGAKILLGSATPSFETYFNALHGKYGFVCLENRYGNVLMPEIMLADIGEFRRKKMMKGSFSPILIKEMSRVLEDGKQVILFQNRRGYSSYIQCDKCGAIPKCKYCDVSLTYYKQKDMMCCRYCGAIVKREELCSDCGGHYRERTPGTEHIEEEVLALFPGKRVARMDMDVMGNKNRFREVIDDFEQGKIDILIGTQMVTKGLDFENVKLVGVMDADSMVHFPDFRAEERAYCMLMQVSGRSGRKGEQGRVVIQTADIQNRVYSMLTEGSYSQFFDLLSDDRKLFSYPPYGRMIQVELRHKEVIILRNAANLLAGKLRMVLGRRVFGPAVPEISRIGGQYRLILILKIESVASFSKIKLFLKESCAFVREDKSFGSLRVICDIDP